MPSYLLTEQGLRKVEAAFEEICEKPNPSIEEMARCVDLDSDTVRKLLRRTDGVKKRTLERLYDGLGWDFEPKLQENIDYILQEPMLGRILNNRYRIIRHLGNRELSETYLAEDIYLPGNPQCVVKRLRSKSSETAAKVFEREATVLYQSGKHNQIPSLFARFEEDEDFYLVHEYIKGPTLNQELIEGQRWSESLVIVLLRDILEPLTLLHQQGFVHGGIKPQNLIRRASDGRIVLTNFGSVKQISTGQTRTYSSPNDGYMAPEQGSGAPELCSDIYAVGSLVIQALTGRHPKQLKVDSRTKDIVWREKAPEVSRKLADILDKMVRYDFTARCQSAGAALQALQDL